MKDNWFDKQLNAECLRRDQEQARQDREYHRRFGFNNGVQVSQDATFAMSGKLPNSYSSPKEERPRPPTVEHCLRGWIYSGSFYNPSLCRDKNA